MSSASKDDLKKAKDYLVERLAKYAAGLASNFQDNKEMDETLSYLVPAIEKLRNNKPLSTLERSAVLLADLYLAETEGVRQNS